jgi:hypothetical protein
MLGLLAYDVKLFISSGKSCLLWKESSVRPFDIMADSVLNYTSSNKHMMSRCSEYPARLGTQNYLEKKPLCL